MKNSSSVKPSGVDQPGQTAPQYPQFGAYPMMVPMMIPNMGFFPQGGPPGQPNPQMMFSSGMMPWGMPPGQTDGSTFASSSQKVTENYHLQETAPKKKPVTEEEYLECFNKEVLPTLGFKRLYRIQAAIRGWYCRRVIVPRKKMWWAIMEDYIANKVDEMISDSIVPDLALEVMEEDSKNKHYDLYGVEFRGEIKYIEELVGRVVGRLAREAVQESISGIAGDYLRKKKEETVTSNDPLELVMFSFIERFARKEAEEITKDGLAEMTDLGIVESQFITFFRRKLLKERVHKLMKEAVDELLCEHFVNQAIERILEGLCEPLALLCAEEEFFDKESAEIDKGFDDLIGRYIMETVLDGINERLEDKNLEYIADQAMKYNKYKDFTEEFLNEILMNDD